MMNSPTSPTLASVPPAFLKRFGDAMTGVLSGFDRLRLRGTLRHLFQRTVMEAYLNACRVRGFRAQEPHGSDIAPILRSKTAEGGLHCPVGAARNSHHESIEHAEGCVVWVVTP